MTYWLKELMTDHHLRRQVVSRVVVWTLGITAFIGLGSHFSYQERLDNALNRARENFQKDVMVRLLIAQPGGGYALPDEKNRPDPHESDKPNAGNGATGDMPFAMGNPAQRAQLMHDLGIPGPEMQGHMVSLTPLHPQNTADPWEQKALHKLGTGHREYWEVSAPDGQSRLRFMGGLVTLESCLRCHAAQGYKVGDIRGGISFTVPLNQDSFLTSGIHNVTTTIGMAVIWVVGLVAILFAGKSNFKRLQEQRLAEAALRESEEQLRTIFDASEAGILLVSPGGIIRFANNRMAEMVGTTVQELIGTHYADHIHESERETGEERVRQFRFGGLSNTFSTERRYIRADGTDFWGHLSAKRLNHPDGSLNGIVGVITDITERKEAEVENAILQTKLQQAHQLENLGSLAGGVAHDMNNVLAAILGLASANIEALPVDSRHHRAFTTIIKAAERGAQMVKSLLSTAKTIDPP